MNVPCLYFIMNTFRHEILGDLKLGNMWFKYFTTPMLIKMIVCGGFALFGLNTLPRTCGFIILYVMIMLYGVVSILLQLFTIPSQNYMKGGGYTFHEILTRKWERKRNKTVYVLGIGKET